MLVIDLRLKKYRILYFNYDVIRLVLKKIRGGCMNESRFTGSMFGLIGVKIVSFFMTLFTLGIGFPWAIAYK